MQNQIQTNKGAFDPIPMAIPQDQLWISLATLGTTFGIDKKNCEVNY